MDNKENSILTGIEKKIYKWLEHPFILLLSKLLEHPFILLLSKLLKHPFILLLVGSILIWNIQQNVLIKLNKQERALAKKYQILTEVASIYTDYYQYMWNYSGGRIGKEDVETMRVYREKIQSTVARAKVIEIQLPILFVKKETLDNWGKFLKIYHDAWYKLSRDGLTEQELNEALDKAAPCIDKVIRDIYSDLVYDNMVLQSSGVMATGNVATSDTLQLSGFSDSQASGPVVNIN